VKQTYEMKRADVRVKPSDSGNSARPARWTHALCAGGNARPKWSCTLRWKGVVVYNTIWLGGDGTVQQG